MRNDLPQEVLKPLLASGLSGRLQAARRTAPGLSRLCLYQAPSQFVSSSVKVKGFRRDTQPLLGSVISTVVREIDEVELVTGARQELAVNPRAAVDQFFQQVIIGLQLQTTS